MMTKIAIKPGPTLDRINHYNSTQPKDNQIEITGNQAPTSGNYDYFQRTGQTIELSGFGSRDKNGAMITGKIGNGEGEKQVAEGALAARGACLNALNNLLTVCNGNLDEIKTLTMDVLIKTDDFPAIANVSNGASNLLNQVFGKFTGAATRATVGVTEIPHGMSVEVKIEATITDKLVKELDLHDAKELHNLLVQLNYRFSLGMTFASQRLEEANVLTKQHKALLYHDAIKVMTKLSNIEIEESAYLAIHPKIKTKDDLIDFINIKVKRLELEKAARKMENLSAQSSLFGFVKNNQVLTGLLSAAALATTLYSYTK